MQRWADMKSNQVYTFTTAAHYHSFTSSKHSATSYKLHPFLEIIPLELILENNPINIRRDDPKTFARAHTRPDNGKSFGPEVIFFILDFRCKFEDRKRDRFEGYFLIRSV